jgi:hypothetical protein
MLLMMMLLLLLMMMMFTIRVNEEEEEEDRRFKDLEYIFDLMKQNQTGSLERNSLVKVYYVKMNCNHK